MGKSNVVPAVIAGSTEPVDAIVRVNVTADAENDVAFVPSVQAADQVNPRALSTYVDTKEARRPVE